MKKSGKISCCGRGGSWFGNCRSEPDVRVGHTWHEGLQACKARAQSKTVIEQQLNGARQHEKGLFNGTGNAHSKTAITAVKPLGFTSAPIADASLIIASAQSPFNTATTLTTSFKPITAAASTAMSVNMSAPTASMVTMPVTVPVRTRVTSQGCGQLLGITVYINFMAAVVFVYFC